MRFTAVSHIIDRPDYRNVPSDFQFEIKDNGKSVATSGADTKNWVLKWRSKEPDGFNRSFTLSLTFNKYAQWTANLSVDPKTEANDFDSSAKSEYGEQAIEDVMSEYEGELESVKRLNTKALSQSEQDRRDAAELDRYYGDVKINLDGYSAVVKYDPDADCWIHDWTMRVPDQYDPYIDPAKRKLGTRKFTLTIIANRQRGSYSHQSWVATLRYAPQIGYNDSGGWGEEATAFSPQEAADSVLKSYTRSMNNWKQSPKSKLNWFLEK